MGLKKLGENKWIDESEDYKFYNFFLIKYFNIEKEKVGYCVYGKEGYVETLHEGIIPKEQLYERIFLPAKTAILAK